MKAPAACVALLIWFATWTMAGAAAGNADTVRAGGLRRCVAGDGVTIFTDRRCADLQAIESTQPAETVRPGVLVRVRSCARNQDDLLFGVRMALENHDANRFADFYHWAGMDTAQGYRLMDRLSAFIERPLVEVRLLSSTPQAEQATPDVGAGVEVPDQSGLDGAEAIAAPARARPAADLLRVDQMRSAEDAAAQVTYFHLRSNAGCWWLQF